MSTNEVFWLVVIITVLVMQAAFIWAVKSTRVITPVAVPKKKLPKISVACIGESFTFKSAKFSVGDAGELWIEGIDGDVAVFERESWRYAKVAEKPNALSDVIGKWPGEETDEQVDKALEELS